MAAKEKWADHYDPPKVTIGYQESFFTTRAVMVLAGVVR